VTPVLKLWRTNDGPVLQKDNKYILLDLQWDEIFRESDPAEFLNRANGALVGEPTPLAPIVSQEVWAAGVTYEVSRTARIIESDSSADVYERVYDAPRPELFFKGNPRTVVGQYDAVRIRKDSKWNVPEPELTLVINSSGRIFGYTIGNDMSSRDIEGENPLYLPQAKIYDSSCALGPAIVIGTPPKSAVIELVIKRDGREVFRNETNSSRIRRPFTELVEYLFRDNTFSNGCFLLTGAGIVPDPSFTLALADQVYISIDGVGTLENYVIQAN